MTLYDICMEIARVENGLAYGQIQFHYDNMMCAMKPGHPADILDDIFCDVGNELCFNPQAEIPTSQLKEMLEELKEFAAAFRISELDHAIEALTAYLSADQQ